MEAKTIQRAEVLKSWDIKEDPDGRIHTFSVKFVTKTGKIIDIKRGTPCGLNMNMKENRMRGIIEVDEKYNKIGHPTPVNIDLIIEFNNLRVKI
ncbi:MAG: hypothetical protein K8S00_12120 [Bacteroidales bacterium]|nr:hypothetical protein [Bacteroidales bacterium]